ncbi:c-type cytochrome [Planctomicrobium sp. SH664]|uniref:c-type cytochrome n=1 Tax=Planctomicrobium sp. SH664 TaxID=3448125 RepID=UPI003F5B572B
MLSGKHLRQSLWMIGLILSLAVECRAAEGTPQSTSEPKKIEFESTLATPVELIQVRPGFKAELLYSVPRDQEGSWVSMCTDPRGRLIVCDQDGGLFRVTPPGIENTTEIKIEKIDVPLGEAQGLLWANNSLYVVVNKAKNYTSGLYQVLDTDGDDQLDTVKTLRDFGPGSTGEHGFHAVRLAPDGKSLYIICGNKCPPRDFTSSRVPAIWDEDVLLPRIYGKGFMRDVPAPGGFVVRTDFEGREWEMVMTGLRNTYDMDFNADGELFGFDADMEWDVNTPWYRPTRVCHLLSGVDFGWRNGSAKFPEYYADTLPPVANIGPGSPTGVNFGYQAKFPAKYQRALYCADWSYGKLYALHLEPKGSTYGATFEEFVSGTPLPFTDVVVNPVDGALYFTTGGRKIQSGLFRITYTGSESTAPVDGRQPEFADQRQLRHTLEALHVGDHPNAVEIAWPSLNHEDPAIRYAARTAIEHRPQAEWATRALNETRKRAKIEALMALARKQTRPTKDPELAVDTPLPKWDGTDVGPTGMATALQVGILTSLGELKLSELTPEEKLAALRVLQLTLLRFGAPQEEVHQALVNQFEGTLPAKSFPGNAMLLDLLVFLQAPGTAAAGVELLESAPSPIEQVQYAKALSQLRTGWTPELRERYFNWFVKSRGFHGGASFRLYIDDIRKAATEPLTKEELEPLQAIIKDATKKNFEAPVETRPFVKDWTLTELQELAKAGLKGRNFEQGRKMFGAGQCFSCHQMQGNGGALGPDLTGLAGRFDANAILESIVEPSRAISDQYAAVQILTTDGKVIVGRTAKHNGTTIFIYPDMLNMNNIIPVKRSEIEQIMPSPASMMPKGLLNTMSEEEVLDLLAFLLSRGDANAAMFQAPVTPQAGR